MWSFAEEQEFRDALKSILDGAAPDAAFFDAYADGVERYLERKPAGEGCTCTNLPPTEDQLQRARRLAELARSNAPREEIVTLAREARGTASEQYLEGLIGPIEKGGVALKAILDGAAPDATALDAYADGVERWMQEEAAGRAASNGPPRTEDELRRARRLAELARTNGPREEIVTLAREQLRADVWLTDQRRT